MFTSDSPGAWCNVGAMVTDADKELTHEVVLRLGKQGAAYSKTMRRAELELSALRGTCLRAVRLGIPVSEVARLCGISRKSIHQWLRT